MTETLRAHERVMRTTTYLIIVRKDGERWIVDQDSEYILEGEGGYPVLELQVDTIRALSATQTESENHPAMSIRKAHIYSVDDVSGKHILIKAFHMNQIAQMYNIALSSLRPYVSLCDPDVQQADIDLTITLKHVPGHIVEDKCSRD